MYQCSVIDVTLLASKRRSFNMSTLPLFLIVTLLGAVVLILTSQTQSLILSLLGILAALCIATVGGLYLRRAVASVGPRPARIGYEIAVLFAATSLIVFLLDPYWNAGDVTQTTLFWVTLFSMNAALCFYVIEDLNNFSTESLGATSIALLRARSSRRPGPFASKRYLSISLWYLIGLLYWCVALCEVALFAAAKFAFRPLVLLNLVFPRFVKPVGNRAARAQMLRRRLSSPLAAQLRANDKRPPVLLLRSFNDDSLVIRSDRTWFDSSDTFEETVTEYLWEFGPVITIGQPNEAIPLSGAAREYVSHEDWQSRVEKLAADASCIVVILGASAGLSWEIDRLDALNLLSKTVIIFPPIGVDLLDDRLKTLSQMVRSSALRDKLALGFPSDSLVVLLDTHRPIVFSAVKNFKRFYREALKISLERATYFAPS
jgi:hypothetical protein